MKRKLSTSAIAILSGLAVFIGGEGAGGSPAHAADIGDYTNDYAQPYNAKEAFKGFGLGIFGGGQFTSIDVGGVFDGVSADGFIGGITGEYLFAAGQFRVGPYLEGGFSNVNVELGGTDLIQQDYFYGGGVKAGAVVYGSSLVYVRGGYERAIWTSDAFPGLGDITADRFVAGGGIETMISSNISLGVGVDYLVPNNVEVQGIDITSSVEDSEHLRAAARLIWRQ